MNGSNRGHGFGRGQRKQRPHINLPQIASGRGQLVLSREPGEAIVIDERVILRVIEIRGNRVRLSFQANNDVNIRRSELEPKGKLECGELTNNCTCNLKPRS